MLDYIVLSGVLVILLINDLVSTEKCSRSTYDTLPVLMISPLHFLSVLTKQPQTHAGVVYTNIVKSFPYLLYTVIESLTFCHFPMVLMVFMVLRLYYFEIRCFHKLCCVF